MQNKNNLMFQVIFIFSDWILIKRVIVFSSLPVFGETKQTFKKFRLKFWAGNWDISKNL